MRRYRKIRQTPETIRTLCDVLGRYATGLVIGVMFPTMKPIEDKGAKPAEPKPAKKLDLSKVEIEPLFTDYVDFETFSKSDFRAVKIKDCFAVPKSKKLLQFTVNDGSGVDRTILSGIHEWYEPEELVGKTAVAITNLPPRTMMGVESN